MEKNHARKSAGLSRRRSILLGSGRLCLGYDPRALGTTASGKTRQILGRPCAIFGTGAIEVALARYDEHRVLDTEYTDLRDKYETRKLLDRAKGILMDQKGLSESDAFRRIQKMSMNTRRPMKDIAQAIIITAEGTRGEPA